jgi:hypothetical protein
VHLAPSVNHPRQEFEIATLQPRPCVSQIAGDKEKAIADHQPLRVRTSSCTTTQKSRKEADLNATIMRGGLPEGGVRSLTEQ